MEDEIPEADETLNSPQFLGAVCRAAIRIVCYRKRINKSELASKMTISRNTFYRFAKGERVRARNFHLFMLQLAEILSEEL